MGKENGEMRMYNPPLEWDDFRYRPILFRIIEVIRGAGECDLRRGIAGPI